MILCIIKYVVTYFCYSKLIIKQCYVSPLKTGTCYIVRWDEGKTCDEDWRADGYPWRQYGNPTPWETNDGHTITIAITIDYV